ncbi:putative multidrug resistance protein [Cellvibrio zantedeschiae]|uniref:Guanidinium exporter n=1 Tax=Cellvibrio zantedeschiae TaxID=1237077 RepID=A0ABQ3BDG0_9GAMM|nr:quaternary ammonium compound efflux SMR transporter SugE [Cellvibrio zantedeschiae]GGY88044.1 putative multidrug resistance protein [Cellvibrio zantedeschiae]
MSWILLVLAGLLEIVWAVGLKYTEGFTRFWPTIITVTAMLVSLAMLGVVMKTLPASTAYAVWMGIGVLGTAILGIMMLNEPATFGRLFSISLILAGVIGLKLTTST